MIKTTVKTLWYYDEIGLLNPAFVDSETSYRFYTTEQLLLLHKIIALRQVGLSINEISAILSGQKADKILEKRRTEIISELDLVREQLSRINFILSGKEEEYFMNYQAIIKLLPECVVYSKKITDPNYDAYFTVIPAIGE